MAIAAGAVGLGGLSEAKHLVRRTAEFHDLAGAQPILIAEPYVKPHARNVWEITSNCSAALTTSSGLTGR